jgi:hypothetical protein
VLGAIATTWALDAWATTVGAAEPTRIDPAAPSVTIAGMMIRLMRIAPPWRLHRSAAFCVSHQLIGFTESQVSYCQYLAFMHQSKSLCPVLQ